MISRYYGIHGHDHFHGKIMVIATVTGMDTDTAMYGNTHGLEHGQG